MFRSSYPITRRYITMSKSKIQVSVTRTIYGKKSGFVATLGEYSEFGKTKEQAIANLQQAIEWHNADFSPVTMSSSLLGTYTLTKTYHGYEITHNSTKCTTVLGRVALEKALESLKAHVSIVCPKCYTQTTDPITVHAEEIRAAYPTLHICPSCASGEVNFQGIRYSVDKECAN